MSFKRLYSHFQTFKEGLLARIKSMKLFNKFSIVNGKIIRTNRDDSVSWEDFNNKLHEFDDVDSIESH